MVKQHDGHKRVLFAMSVANIRPANFVSEAGCFTFCIGEIGQTKQCLNVRVMPRSFDGWMMRRFALVRSTLVFSSPILRL